jgi:hypothetical protein
VAAEGMPRAPLRPVHAWLTGRFFQALISKPG